MDSSASLSNGEPRTRSRILIVDDKRPSLVALEAVLETLGADCVGAESGEAALRLLLEQEFALILLDVNMPIMNGFEVARFIRSRNRLRCTPIIFVTGEDRDDRSILAAYELGAVDFLFKPVVPEILRAKASLFIDLSRQAELIREHEAREHARALELARRKWDEESLRSQMEQLAQLDRRKDQFLAMLGHELRNPLAPIVAGLELLKHRIDQSPQSDEVIARTREVMHRQVEHLIRLVDDLLDISRINSDKLRLQKARTSVQDVIAQSVVTSRPWIDQREHELVSDVPLAPLFVEGDRVRLVQMVSNLLNNAARYTPSKGKINICCRRQDDQVEVRVSDNGQGISGDLLPLVFEPFVQRDQTRSNGLGLGLAIVRQLVMLHGGTVSAFSEGEGRGSDFVIRLPLLTGTPEASAGAASSPSSDTCSARFERVAVVLIEDNADVRELLSTLLTAWGHDVEVASDGITGSELILTRRPDVALIDIGLPDMDGYGVVDLVRRSAGEHVPRLIAMTGYGQESDRKRALEAGFDGHLVKPADASALRAVLTRAER